MKHKIDIDEMKRPKQPKGDIKPQHQYDCVNCALNWCCGPLCACQVELPSPSRSHAWSVHVAQVEWRKRIALQEKYDELKKRLKMSAKLVGGLDIVDYRVKNKSIKD